MTNIGTRYNELINKQIQNCLDRIAPQCAIPGLNWNQSPYGRIRFQGEEADFLESHYSKNYGWVLNNIDEDQDGYVQPR